MHHRQSKKHRREETLDTWQRRWSESDKGRETFQYLPGVRTGIETKWGTDKYVTQFVTGHGNFYSKAEEIQSSGERKLQYLKARRNCGT